MNKGKILVVGAGTMGHGIAQVFAMGGYDVSLFSLPDGTLDRAKALIQSSLDVFAKEGLLDGKQIAGILKRIRMTHSLEEGAADADIAFESIAEDAVAKQDIFARLDALCPRKTLLASNTTALNIFDFVKTSRPEKVLIAHWYTPPQLIPLVDVVKGPQTDEESIAAMVRILKETGKTPVVFKKFINGYVISRLQIALNREVLYLLDNDYVTPEELDLAAKTGFALRMLVVGLVQRIDFGGLDLTVRNLDNPHVRSQMVPLDYQPKKIYELVKQGHLGVKTGKGFYDYGGRSEAEVCRERDIRLIKMLKTYKEIGENSV